MSKKVNTPEGANNQGNINYIDIDLSGNKAISKPVFRMFSCRVCKQPFKQSEGALFISGFYCDDHNPKRFS